MRALGVVIFCACFAAWSIAEDPHQPNVQWYTPDLRRVQVKIGHLQELGIWFLNHDWLTEVATLRWKGKQAANDFVAKHALYFARIRWSPTLVDKEERLFFSCYRSTTLTPFIRGVLQHFKRSNSSQLQSLQKDVPPLSSESIRDLDSAMNSIASVQFSKIEFSSHDETSVVTLEGRVTQGSSSTFLMLVTALEALDGGVWPWARANAIFNSACSRHGALLDTAASVLLEGSVWYVFDLCVALLQSAISHGGPAFSWLDHAAKGQSAAFRGMLVVLPFVLLLYIATVLWIELVFFLAGAMQKALVVVLRKIGILSAGKQRKREEAPRPKQE